ncbi:MAG: bifunctional 3,4-dihydroxy-2-butanone-4-phosphate synthase/GTP cyclohydrolase II [Calditrichaeota bacterium]|nr:bifunctional 3,4-dihydroxy-2-butanone-4-phosphate synthase/GTP cyclohydrolase II [Calditrichota bacterium]
MIASIAEAISEFVAGRMLIVVDDEDRENEGDLILPAGKITPQAVHFMARYGRGMICLPLTAKRCEELNLTQMVQDNSALHGTAFTVTIDYKFGTTTGISAYDRALTIKKSIDPSSIPEDFARPGHIHPLKAAEGGVLMRAGHTEATVDLARLAGLEPAGVLCEILDDDGQMARMPRLKKFAAEHNLKIVTIRDLIDYRRRDETLVFREVEVDFPTAYGNFKLIHYRNRITREHHLAIVKGEISGPEPVLVRVHSSCLTGDVFGSARCDCGEQLHTALRMIEREGRGIVLYMNQEGRGIGLAAKLQAYKLQDQGLDTVEANLALGFADDLRDYGSGALMLKNLGVSRLRLMTNNPRKIVALKGFDLEVTERVPIEIPPTGNNVHYLKTKRDKLGHRILQLKAEAEG